MKFLIRAKFETNSPQPGTIQPGIGMDVLYNGIASRGGGRGVGGAARLISIYPFPYPKFVQKRGSYETV